MKKWKDELIKVNKMLSIMHSNPADSVCQNCHCLAINLDSPRVSLCASATLQTDF